MAGGMWPNCLGAVKKAGIRCPHQLVVGGDIPDGGAGGAGDVLSTFYVLMVLNQSTFFLIVIYYICRFKE